MSRGTKSNSFSEPSEYHKIKKVIASPKKNYYINTKFGKVKEFTKDKMYEASIVSYPNHAFKTMEIMNNFGDIIRDPEIKKFEIHHKLHALFKFNL